MYKMSKNMKDEISITTAKGTITVKKDNSKVKEQEQLKSMELAMER